MSGISDRLGLVPDQPLIRDERKNALEQERRRQVRGSLLLAFGVLIFSLWRFGFDRVFTQGWWRLW